MSAKNAYTKRISTSIPAPIEVDSDSDFAPGAYVPEVKPKKKARNSTAGPSSRKRRRVDDDGATSKESKSRKRSRVTARTSEPNPLLKYFVEDLDSLNLHSASEEEEEDPEVPLFDKGVQSSDSEEDDEEEQEEPVKLKTWFFNRERQSTNSQSPKPSQTKATTAQNKEEEDSITESESSADEAPRPSYPNSGPSRIVKPPDEDDSVTESETESESEPELPGSIAPQGAMKKVSHLGAKHKAVVEEADSVTESESEPEIAFNPKLRPKPGFPLNDKQQHERALVLDEESGTQIPAAINTYLRNYQRDGARFLWRQYKEGRGGLLGDDMGLGKTIQVISFLSAIMKKDGIITDKHRRRKYVSKLQDKKAWRERRELPKANAKWPTCLIIAPSTVVHNWEREFQTWGYFEVGLYTGTPKEREEVLHSFKMGRLDVIVTSFDLARRDINLLDDLAWSCIIVDEVHRVKNEVSKITQAYHQFNCLRRFGLTGTTIQNSYKEMWTILDWTNPDRLGSSRQWHGYVVKPLTAGQSAGATEEERAKAVAVARILRDKLLPNFFLRRTKDIIKDQLPQKTDQVVFCPLTDKQISAYRRLLEMDALQNLIHRDDPCTCGSRKSRKSCCHPFVAGDVFRYMSVLIKLSNHLGLILPGPNDSPEQTSRNRVLAEIAFPDGNIPKYGTAMMQPQYCGKWAALEVLLKEWRKDRTNKVLIFTKSVKLLEMLDFHLQTRGYGFLKLDGSTKQHDRMPMIDKFNTDPDVYIFLISTLAGGTGLNLTGANKVVIFDPNWNPAHNLQAMDRAFRFGQNRDVSVYRLLGAGSVEELIYARQIYKQQQMAIGYEASVQTRYFEGIQGDNAKKGELFGINNIFKLHEDKLATKMAIEKANLAELDWALANMDAGSRGKKQSKGTNELVEADTKVGKDDGNMKGLGALLFDDDPPLTTPREQDVIQKTLNAIGVRYSHMNDEILVPSKIEEERTKQTLLKVRKRKSKMSEKKEASPKPQWPPKRRHHKPQPTPEQQLNSRHRALIQLGMINSPEDVPAFARDFARQSAEAQRQIIAELDQWSANRAESDSSSD
ncbi:hypothetical protein M413DRAFT_445116 [Hebeloma cylindrosporum]|uniref:Uncharacterized protein n=1 Tax=Hebeloma cylindrosporum TaxID=76867 RepID=A0A0C2YLK0_HEBCY|nr:hypothetical protein M413DRAFT_445116 [Hebeloma cylindrosporum h7]